MANSKAFISFPEGYLGASPAKFPLMADEERYFAVSKPSGLSCFQHEWELGNPDFSAALRRELLLEKAQLARLGIQGVFRVYSLDEATSGVLLFAKDAAMEDAMKNACGSDQFTFRFQLVATSSASSEDMVCDLPLVPHSSKKRMVVSHQEGKKCATHFRKIRNMGRYQLWEAETSDLRMHQVRLHAWECGLRILGEKVYCQGGSVMLSGIKSDYRGSARKEEEPLYDGLSLHLSSVSGKPCGDSPEFTVAAPLPSRLENQIRQLAQYKPTRARQSPWR